MVRIKNENTGWKTKIYIRESIMKLGKYHETWKVS